MKHHVRDQVAQNVRIECRVLERHGIFFFLFLGTRLSRRRVERNRSSRVAVVRRTGPLMSGVTPRLRSCVSTLFFTSAPVSLGSR